MPVQCQPLSSVVEPSFWTAFSEAKLDTFKLSDSAVGVRGWYAPARSANLAAQLRVGGDDLVISADAAASAGHEGPRPQHRAFGKLFNTNTVEAFKELDKKALLHSEGAALLGDIRQGRADVDPSLLVRFCIVSYADLKRHKFLHWFCFPAVVDARLGDLSLAAPDLPEGAWAALLPESEAPGAAVPAVFGVLNDSSVASLAELVELAGQDALAERLVCLGFVDPGSQDAVPGWPLLNLCTWALERLGSGASAAARDGALRVLCLRRSREASLLATVELAAEAAGSTSEVAFAGWEPNAQGKMGPRLTDLSAQLDPEKLAQAACDLNLRLMRWRALPELDTEMLAATSCLLVGSGTLGCAVSRCLLGWGFRRITLIDNGRVSYSNPVRQSLFEFEDCKEGGRPKAEAAAAALRKIVPGVEAEGVQLNIPMPGHFVTSPALEADARASAAKLEELVQAHDVVVLLTDTRESRWLPTMLAAKHDKLVLNSALGFDSFMVMRHGSGPRAKQQGADRLGCYFCNDVVAPQNSLKDRTLDQQCTVTRPGLAPIASALLVELLVGVLHHPRGNQAPPPLRGGAFDQGASSVAGGGGLEELGELPHQVRGSLPRFDLMTIRGEAFPQCTACSSKVVEQFEAEGFAMLQRAFNEPSYLEDLTGLSALRSSSAVEELLLDDLDGFDEDEDGEALC